MVISLLKSFYDKDYHNLSKKKVDEYRESIEVNYKLLADKYGKAFFDVEHFKERFNKAVERKFNLHEFFKLEIQAIDAFIEKIKEAEVQEKKSLTNFFERVYSEEEDVETKPDSVLEKIYSQFEERIRAYDQVPIHEDASEEIERLLGCLLEFEKKSYPALLTAEKWMKREKEFHTYFLETKMLFEDLTLVRKGNLPFIFTNYHFKVENAGGDDNLIELADIDVLKKVVELIKRVKKITQWFNHPSLTGYNDAFIKYGEEKLRFVEFKNCIKSDCNKILRDFRLYNF